uniref:helix-turn-helix domain-containing protein n=1 Tax=uncultured Draconibacterium sp. TaxID=1573823 RepID=UPI003216CB20
MPKSRSDKNDFIRRITQIVEENISSEQFGVSDLADSIGMSRSNLLRKVKSLTNLSVSQFIRNVRLNYAKELLRETSLTVSEIAYKVGFGSPSYFIKCFGDLYGYPPGEEGKEAIETSEIAEPASSEHSHRLAAIMFTDIQGYTALMQQDEQKAIEFRNRHREVFNSVTNKFSGKILQYFGDGTLSTFNSAIDAVRCGIELQLAFRAVPEIPVRIGIHSGDIIFSEDGIIGDGVNIAARIESLALSGSVFVSEKVSDEVKNQKGINCVYLGEFQLKNVSKPMGVCALAHPGLVVPDKGKIAGATKVGLVKKVGRNIIVSGHNEWIKWSLAAVVIFVLGYLVSTSGLFKNDSLPKPSGKKSIAVLPFINDSSDSSNVYIVNGLMESTLNNLQKIKDLRVISRTSVEQYRLNLKTTPEIAKELNAMYLIEGSGQKIGNRILLNIQLIEAATDNHLWSKQYKKNTEDIFALQAEVAKNIAEEIEVILTPEEMDRIEKKPTNNLVAYDLFLQGLDLLQRPTPENLENSISCFLQAIQYDTKFARSYAAIAIAYYLLDEGKAEKHYSDSINYYADQALFFDSKLPQSLIAKALFYMEHKEYELAVPYFEKVLEVSPNNDLVLIFLVDLYVNHLPNTEKYLEYALKGLEIDVVAAYDSAAASYSFLHISNAFIQSGFVGEAEKYVNKSLRYLPDNLYSEYLKAYILYSKNRDLEQLRDLLLRTFEKDKSRLDILQEVAKAYYYLGDYKTSFVYYKKFTELRETYHLDIYNSENGKIAYVFDKAGEKELAEKYIEAYKSDADKMQSIYKHYNLALYYSYKGDTQKAIEHLQLFSEEDNFHYWTILFTPIEPLAQNMMNHSGYQRIFLKLEDKFNQYHKRIEVSLKEKGLL